MKSSLVFGEALIDSPGKQFCSCWALHRYDLDRIRCILPRSHAVKFAVKNENQYESSSSDVITSATPLGPSIVYVTVKRYFPEPDN